MIDGKGERSMNRDKRQGNQFRGKKDISIERPSI